MALTTSSLNSMIAKANPFVIVGDFNAQNTAWGYKHAQTKGRDLWNSIQHDLILLTDPLMPTQCGNSVMPDTTPDLSLIEGEALATWCNTGEDIGSGHRILYIVV